MRTGNRRRPATSPRGATKKCDAIFAPIKETVYTQLEGFGGIACDYLWFIQALVKGATSLQPAKLAPAMHTIGTVDLSYPIAPTNYAAGHPKFGLRHCRLACRDLPRFVQVLAHSESTWNPPFK